MPTPSSVARVYILNRESFDDVEFFVSTGMILSPFYTLLDAGECTLWFDCQNCVAVSAFRAKKCSVGVNESKYSTLFEFPPKPPSSYTIPMVDGDAKSPDETFVFLFRVMLNCVKLCPLFCVKLCRPVFVSSVVKVWRCFCVHTLYKPLRT